MHIYTFYTIFGFLYAFHEERIEKNIFFYIISINKHKLFTFLKVKCCYISTDKHWRTDISIFMFCLSKSNHWSLAWWPKKDLLLHLPTPAMWKKWKSVYSNWMQKPFFFTLLCWGSFGWDLASVWGNQTLAQTRSEPLPGNSGLLMQRRFQNTHQQRQLTAAAACTIRHPKQLIAKTSNLNKAIGFLSNSRSQLLLIIA